MHSDLSSISNLVEHTGQDVSPGALSIAGLPQNGHFNLEYKNIDIQLREQSPLWPVFLEVINIADKRRQAALVACPLGQP